MRYKNIQGSGLLLVIIMTLVLATYINEYQFTIWQQKRLLNVEKIRRQSISLENKVLKQALDILVNYKKLMNIPQHKEFRTDYAKIRFELIHDYNYPNDKIKACTQYSIYRLVINLVINSRIDLNALDKYHKKIYLYVIVCEYIQDNSSNEEGLSALKVLPITNVLY